MSDDEVSALIDDAVVDLRSTGAIEGDSRCMSIEYPACILYYGKNSASFHDSIFKNLRSEWGSVVDLIPFYSILSLDFEYKSFDQSPSMHGYALMDLRRDETVSIDRFQQSVTNMLQCREEFSDMRRCVVFCILDTRGMEVEEFRKWYKLIEDIRHVLTNATCITLLLTLVDKTVGKGERATEITQELANIYEGDDLGVKNDHLYDGVFLYTNQCMDTAYNRLYKSHNPQEHGEWNVLSDVILLANSEYLDPNLNCKKLLFSASNNPAVTAALKQVDTPFRDIAIATVRHLINRLAQDFVNAKKQSLPTSIIREALGFKDGNSHITDIYENQIDCIISEFSGFERGLPNWPVDESSVNGLSYVDADKEAYGCLSAFIAVNHMRELDIRLTESADGLNRIDDLIESQFAAAVTVPQLLSLSKSEWEREVGIVFSDMYLDTSEVSDVHGAVSYKLHYWLKERVQEHTLSVIEKIYSRAIQVEKELTKLNSSIVSRNRSKKFNLDNFYGKIVNSFYTGKSDYLLRNIFSVCNSSNYLVSNIRKCVLNELLSYNYNMQDIYKLGFMDELTLRMLDGKSPDAAQAVIGADLVKDIPDLVGYYSIHHLTGQQVEAYLMHVDTNVAGIDWASSSGKLYSYLNKRTIPAGTSRVFLNIGRRDSASSLWFYALDTQHLRG